MDFLWKPVDFVTEESFFEHTTASDFSLTVFFENGENQTDSPIAAFTADVLRLLTMRRRGLSLNA
jgi:hypothetical protein